MTTGDLTEQLENASADSVFAVAPGIWRIAKSIVVRAKVRFDSGVLRPDPGVIVRFEQEIDAAPGKQIFDLAHYRWRRGVKQMNSPTRQQTLWETEGNLRMPGLVYATWFGARPEYGYDSTLPIQAMLDSGASEAVLDGRFLHTANWVGNNQRLRGLGPFGGAARTGLKTIPLDRSFNDLINKADAASPADDSFRGLSTKSGIESVVFADFEYDGSASEHFDHKTLYRAYQPDNDETGSGAGNFRRHQLRQGGINIAQGDGAGAYVAPARTLIERVFIHDTVRNAIVANRARAVTIRDCRLANSDTDHLIYADRNPDLLVERVTLSGYAHGAMIVVSGGTLRDCVVRDLEKNPIPARATESVVWLRADLPEPTTIENFRITGDLGTLGKGIVLGKVFKISGTRHATIRNIEINQEGYPNARYTVFGTQRHAREIEVEDLKAFGMPRDATLWDTEFDVSNLRMTGTVWETAGDYSLPYLMRFRSLSDADFDTFQISGARLGAFVYVDRAATRTRSSGIRSRLGMAREIDSARR